MALPQLAPLTLPEYLALEVDTGIRHEYSNGVVRSMAGGTPGYARVTSEVNAILWSQLRGKPCKPFSNDLKVSVAGHYFYPDTTVVCPPVKYDAALPDAITNPRVIIEVLSPSTERYDSGEKFDHYRRIAELTDYVLIDSMRQYARHFTRIDSDHWRLEFLGPESTLHLESIECSFPLRDCYEGLEMLGDGFSVG